MSDVVHVKAFMTPMAEHATVTREIGRSFGGQRVPPIVLTEWVSTTPIEIELVVHGRTLAKPDEPVAYLPLPDMTTSPYYSRVATVAPGTPVIFLSAVYSGEGGGTPREQWKRVFAQFGGALLDAGSSFRHLVKATYYLGNASAREAMGEIRGVYYDPTRPPSASAADVKSLGRPGMVMLDMIAVPAKAETRAGK
jgi:enamine deaminase RidA (YjgF/YER057c/UK114 family)